jgi:FixJ family two-component response regulator
MPGMKGPDFVARAHETRPDLRVVYMSGDIGDTPPEAFGGWPLLPKPFTSASLSEVVGQALAG